ncbi:DNA-3-methyladenine glycosylase family protein [Streptomyces cinnamoneus]|uniref:3-methyladenine DNA glycosylase n=1 Tax=Streptomyces cinnamoneus TaxID=53446 RepID=A0A918TYP5_STRCJ|nr:DNA-3-methyladenine glycosylase 2 family protein [Streptomyces cinnamoneus]GHC67626.1 3-methyladenine DNA glycosylase [Streptomyces cinnamoneus]
MASRTWVPPGPYDLGRTLCVLARGPGDPAYRVTGDGAIWRASRTPQGPGTLRITAVDGEVHAEAWGPGADWLLETLPSLLGAADDPAAFTPRHRLVHETHRRNPGLRLARTGLVLESLVPSILEQKVTSDEAYRAWRLLLQRHGEPAPGPAPRMHVMPDPRAWSLIPSWEWHRAGVDDKRAATIVRAARVASRLEEAAGMDDARASARLQAVPGIGPWTTAETLQRTNGSADAVTVGDLHLPRIVGYALTGTRGTTDETMLELLSPYEGQRHRACRLILLSGVAPPRRAPRFAPRDFTRI